MERTLIQGRTPSLRAQESILLSPYSLRHFAMNAALVRVVRC